MSDTLRFFHPDGRVTSCPVDIGHEYQRIRLGCAIILGEGALEGDCPIEPCIVINERSATDFDVDEHPLAAEIRAAHLASDTTMYDEQFCAEYARIISRPVAEA